MPSGFSGLLQKVLVSDGGRGIGRTGTKWECCATPPVIGYMEQISLVLGVLHLHSLMPVCGAPCAARRRRCGMNGKDHDVDLDPRVSVNHLHVDTAAPINVRQHFSMGRNGASKHGILGRRPVS